MLAIPSEHARDWLTLGEAGVLSSVPQRMRVYHLKESVSFKARKNFPPVSQNVVKHWNFKDDALNGTTQQVNRQKSALNLSIADFDTDHKIAYFDDDDGLNTTTPNSCSCRDFNFVGNGRRKKFYPCKHIYRLCFELGSMTPKHFDHKMRERMAPKVSWEERVRQVLEHLKGLPRDETKWGSWHSEVHEEDYQIRRQLRAFDMVHRFPADVQKAKSGFIRDYETSLSTCTCPDFLERGVPCKHIYARAIIENHSLPVTVDDYLQNQGEVVAESERIFIPFYDSTSDSNG